MIEIKVPTVGESINEVTLIKWLKKDGDLVQRDEFEANLRRLGASDLVERIVGTSAQYF